MVQGRTPASLCSKVQHQQGRLRERIISLGYGNTSWHSLIYGLTSVWRELQVGEQYKLLRVSKTQWAKVAK